MKLGVFAFYHSLNTTQKGSAVFLLGYKERFDDIFRTTPQPSTQTFKQVPTRRSSACSRGTCAYSTIWDKERVNTLYGYDGVPLSRLSATSRYAGWLKKCSHGMDFEAWRMNSLGRMFVSYPHGSFVQRAVVRQRLLSTIVTLLFRGLEPNARHRVEQLAGHLSIAITRTPNDIAQSSKHHYRPSHVNKEVAGTDNTWIYLGKTHGMKLFAILSGGSYYDNTERSVNLVCRCHTSVARQK